MKYKKCQTCETKLLYIRENQWLCVNCGLQYGMHADATYNIPLLDNLRHMCGSVLTMTFTRDDKMVRAYCPSCMIYPQFNSMYIAYDWLSISRIMEFIIELDRLSFKDKVKSE